MDYKEQLIAFFKDVDARCILGLSIDCVIFGFYDNQLKVLLLRWKQSDEWGLPGGFIYKKESVDVAAQRILEERTGIKELFLQQFHTFGEEVRYNRAEISRKLNWPDNSTRLWPDRTVSIGYFALVDFMKVTPTADFLTDEYRWLDVEKLPPLLFDHNHIIEVALKTLRVQLSWQPVGYNLLPEKFTMPELQRLYETILNRPLDPRNFSKKMRALGIIERLEEQRKGGAFKSPYLFRFDKEKYKKALQEGHLSFS
ncbi:NUDIX hydrolase [Larkinella terrae]|uniref:NUDIX domain-containing protein n=1 Tax=Larkinella terrae TaxID=2025311 RepID=A0A7K0ELH5_9BACT|nr:NUDIX domain-containing protein [Larkinella terrae]MRS62391.1 NUDIX domain-containing protein [Larkinella terrae]